MFVNFFIFSFEFLIFLNLSKNFEWDVGKLKDVIILELYLQKIGCNLKLNLFKKNIGNKWKMFRRVD